MNSPSEKENLSVDLSTNQNCILTESSSSSSPTKLTEMTSRTVEEISHRIEEVFAKLQRNLEHNTRVFQEKSQGLLNKIDQAEDQLRKVLSQLETAATGGKSGKTQEQSEEPAVTNLVVAATESIALSEESTKLEADETTEN